MPEPPGIDVGNVLQGEFDGMITEFGRLANRDLEPSPDDESGRRGLG